MKFKGKQTLIISIVLLAVAPFFPLGYLLYEKRIAFALPSLIFIGVVSVLAIIVLRRIGRLFGAISATVAALKKAAEDRETLPMAGDPGSVEPDGVAAVVNDLAERLEKSTEALNRRDVELNALRGLSVDSSAIRSVEALLQGLLLDKSMTVTNSLIGSVFLYDSAAGRLRMIAARGLTRVEENYSVGIDDSLMKTVIHERKPLIVHNIEDDPRTLKANDPRYGSPSFVSMPILMGSELVAVLNLSHKEENHPFDADDERILSIIVDEIGPALERVNLRTCLDSHAKKLEEQDILLGRECADRQQAEEQWKRYKFIVDVSKRFLTLINRDYIYEAASYGFCQAHKLTAGEVVGRSVADIWGEEDFNGIIKASLDRCFAGEDVAYEKSFEFPALGVQHFSVSYWPYCNDAGITTHVVVFTQNITERKNLEMQLAQAQKLKALGTLAGGIAHDFNNLLMAIQGYTSLTLMGTDPGSPNHEKLRAIEKQVLAGVNLTRQLLGFARGGKYEVTPLNMNEILEQTAAMFGRTKKQILIGKDFQEDLWTVEADRNQLEQVLLNLYLNAWQAMPGGGNLSLRTANETITGADRKIAYIAPGRYVKISIADTGVGMDEYTKQRIFEPFFTTREMGRGTGLGLAMVYGIIKNHSGYITVSSEKGQGTTFTIYLPVSDKTPSAVKEKKKPGPVLKGQETILLIDDEQAIIDVMREIMEMLGYTVLAADNGRDALKIYEENRDAIGLVILDMIMPDMGGGVTFDGLRQINPQVKVLLSSGYSLDSEAAAIMAKGCRGFLQKPVNIAVLSQKIRDVLEK